MSIPMQNNDVKDPPLSNYKCSEKATIETFWKFNNKLGFYKRFYGVDYQRCLEYPVAYNQLDINESVTNYLDIGTGKYSIFPLYVAYHNPKLFAKLTDINSHVFKQVNYINKFKLLKNLYNKSMISIEKQDAQTLTYQNNSFDRVSAISSIEHIPDNGDTLAVKEIVRVLKPNGKAIITLPYKFNGYEALYRHKKSKEDKGEFFSHYYDDKALSDRILIPSGIEIDSILYLGENNFPYFDFWCTKVPIRNTLKYFLGWTHIFMAKRFYRILEKDNRSKAHVAVITLVKRET